MGGGEGVSPYASLTRLETSADSPRYLERSEVVAEANLLGYALRLRRYRLNWWSPDLRQLSQVQRVMVSLVKPGPAKTVGRRSDPSRASFGSRSCSWGTSCPISSGETVMNFSSTRSARARLP